MKKIPTKKTFKINSFLVTLVAKENLFWGITPEQKIGILWKLVHLQAITKPHAYQKKIIFYKYFLYSYMPRLKK